LGFLVKEEVGRETGGDKSLCSYHWKLRKNWVEGSEKKPSCPTREGEAVRKTGGGEKLGIGRQETRNPRNQGVMWEVKWGEGLPLGPREKKRDEEIDRTHR